MEIDNNTLKYKIKKYKYKMSKLKKDKNMERVRLTTDEIYQRKYEELHSNLKKNVLDINLVVDISDFFEESAKKSYNVENMHILADDLSNKFIQDIASHKLNDIGNIRDISILINRLNEQNYLKWYS